MTQLPTKIKLKPEQVAALKQIENEQVALQQFVQMVTEQGQNRGAALAAKLKKVWTEIAADHGIDLQHVAYAFDGTDTAVPTMVRM